MSVETAARFHYLTLHQRLYATDSFHATHGDAGDAVTRVLYSPDPKPDLIDAARKLHGELYRQAEQYCPPADATLWQIAEIPAHADELLAEKEELARHPFAPTPEQAAMPEQVGRFRGRTLEVGMTGALPQDAASVAHLDGMLVEGIRLLRRISAEPEPWRRRMRAQTNLHLEGSLDILADAYGTHVDALGGLPIRRDAAGLPSSDYAARVIDGHLEVLHAAASVPTPRLRSRLSGIRLAMGGYAHAFSRCEQARDGLGPTAYDRMRLNFSPEEIVARKARCAFALASILRDREAEIAAPPRPSSPERRAAEAALLAAETRPSASAAKKAAKRARQRERKSAEAAAPRMPSPVPAIRTDPPASVPAIVAPSQAAIERATMAELFGRVARLRDTDVRSLADPQKLVADYRRVRADAAALGGSGAYLAGELDGDLAKVQRAIERTTVADKRDIA